MQNQTQKQKTIQANRREAVFCWSMILFACFEVILLIAVLGRTFKTAAPLEKPSIKDDQTTLSDETTTAPNAPNVPSAPVFSGGVTPTYPTTTKDTKTISDIYSGYAVLVEVESGKIVASKQSSQAFSPASMTKVMTLIVATESLTTDQLDKKITMTQAMYDYARADGYAGSTLFGIDVDDQYSVRDLLYGIGMKSASDCVVPIVFSVSETEEAFVDLMNGKVAELNLKNTHFDNAIGYASENNYTTAEDMAVIMAYAMQNDLIADILGKEVYKSTAAGYNSAGEFKPSFPISFYSTLFGDHDGSRMAAYKTQYGKAFTLSTTKLVAGKTGMTEDNYCLVSYAVSNSNGKAYVLVLGQASKKYYTMYDVKAILDAYIT